MWILVRMAVLGAVSLGAIVCGRVSSFAQQSARGAEPTATIAGRVTIDGNAARGVMILLLSADDNADSKTVARSTTDEEGSFHLMRIPPGRYHLVSFAPAFITQSEGLQGQSDDLVTISDAESVEGIHVALIRGGVITGRVTDSSSQPVIGEHMVLSVLDDRGGRQRFYPTDSSSTETDDRGVYRIYGLPPGRYLVSVGREPDAGSYVAGGQSSYPLTFHPGVTDESRASVVGVVAGKEAVGTDIMLSAVAKTYSVSGRIIASETGKPISGIEYVYAAVENDSRISGSYDRTGRRSDLNGVFRFEGIAPGRYCAFAIREPQSPLYSERTLFEVKDGDLAGLEIKVQRGSRISGVAVIEHTDDQDIVSKLSELRLNAIPEVSGMGSAQPAGCTIASDGAFSISGLPPGKVSLHLDLANPSFQGEFSLLRVERDGVVQPDGILIESGESATGVKVIISYGTASIRGLVILEGGRFAEGTHLMVLAHRKESSSTDRRVELDSRNRFLMEGLAPGEYELSVRAILIPGFPTPPPIPDNKQSVTVTNGTELEVKLVINLSSGDNQVREQGSPAGRPSSPSVAHISPS